MRKIKKGDEVIVLTGRERGRHGKVLRWLNEGERLIIEGLNLVKKHVKPNPQKNEQGGILEREASVHVSNVAVFNSATQKADRVTIKTLDDGRRVRVFKSNGELVDV